MIHRILTVLLAGSTLWLASCGGGEPQPSAAVAAAASLTEGARPARRALAAPAAAAATDPDDAAQQLFDYAQTYYPEHFPGRPATQTAAGWIYRHYAANGVYLGVRDGDVYVLGGPFGTEIVAAGPLTQFITPQPRVVLTLCSAAGAMFDTFATPHAAVGRNAGVSLAGCSEAIASVTWRQTAGPAVALLAERTQTLSFDPAEPGRYAFEAAFTDARGRPNVAAVGLDVAAAATSPARLTLRASHSVRMGGKVSVRAWPTVPEGDAVKAVTWTQIEGPAVELDTRTNRLALFTAPQVPRDTLVRLRATLYTNNGLVAGDEVVVLVERHAQAAASDTMALWGGDHVPRVYAYKSGGPYRALLQGCIYDAAQFAGGPRHNLCPLWQLPMLAQEAELPSVEQVMDRVLVSHDWLGRNFEQFLRQHDTRGDFRRMLRSTTAIVLSTHVRPSFYFAGTGAIYLDADSFWLTPEERDLINESPDYRSDFGNALQFDMRWRYVRDGRNLFAFYDPEARVARTLDAVHDETAWLLYHELAHALDYVPPAEYAFLRSDLTVWGNITPRFNSYALTSDRLAASHPLTAWDMFDLARVMYRGVTPTPEQLAFTPAQVAALFAADLATDDYAYTTAFEDVAMTLEELLMQRRLGIRRDVAVTDRYPSGTPGSQVIVRWGQRGRSGEPALRERARFVAQQLVPWLDPAEVDQLPAPLPLRAGESWTANLSPQAMVRRAQSLGAAASLHEMRQAAREAELMRRQRGGPRLPPSAR